MRANLSWFCRLREHKNVAVLNALGSVIGAKLEPCPADVAYQRMNMQLRQAKKEIESDVFKATRESQAGAISAERHRAVVEKEYAKFRELNAKITARMAATQRSEAGRASAQ